MSQLGPQIRPNDPNIRTGAPKCAHRGPSCAHMRVSARFARSCAYVRLWAPMRTCGRPFAHNAPLCPQVRACAHLCAQVRVTREGARTGARGARRVVPLPLPRTTHCAYAAREGPEGPSLAAYAQWVGRREQQQGWGPPTLAAYTHKGP